MRIFTTRYFRKLAEVGR